MSIGTCTREPPDGREKRYTNEPEKHFDWFLKPDYLLPIFEKLTADAGGKEARILMLGCGNSMLGEVMYDAGWKNIVNVDVRVERRWLMTVLCCGHRADEGKAYVST